MTPAPPTPAPLGVGGAGVIGGLRPLRCETERGRDDSREFGVASDAPRRTGSGVERTGTADPRPAGRGHRPADTADARTLPGPASATRKRHPRRSSTPCACCGATCSRTDDRVAAVSEPLTEQSAERVRVDSIEMGFKAERAELDQQIDLELRPGRGRSTSASTPART